MKYEISWQNKATKQLFKLDAVTQKRIRDGVNTLTDSESWHNVRPLTNHKYSHRLRVGNYRILFDADTTPGINDEIRILDIQEVKKRDDRTY